MKLDEVLPPFASLFVYAGLFLAILFMLTDQFGGRLAFVVALAFVVLSGLHLWDGGGQDGV